MVFVLGVVLLNAISVHVAGHAAVLHSFMPRFLPRLEVQLDGPMLDGMNLAQLGAPQNWDEARRFTAYFDAGRAAVAYALGLGLPPPDTDPLHGYSIPMGEGAELAEQQVQARWPRIERLARAFLP